MQIAHFIIRLYIITSLQHAGFLQQSISTKPAMCTVAWEVLGREGEQTLHGDRDLLFCRLNCGTERDGQPLGRLPFFETLQRNKQAFLS